MSVIGNDWDEVLNYVVLTNAKRWAASQRNLGDTIYPARNQELLAFKLTPYSKVRAVILGQDPYPGVDRNNKPHAHGLAFSSQSKVDIPMTLRNIFLELKLEYGKLRSKADLTDWAEQGVLLLNTALTVVANKPNSHQGIKWTKVITDALRQINKKRNLVFLLWGANARITCVQAGIDAGKHQILTATHPSPISAHNGWFSCNHFRQANTWLESHGLERIDWIGGDYYV